MPQPTSQQPIATYQHPGNHCCFIDAEHKSVCISPPAWTLWTRPPLGVGGYMWGDTYFYACAHHFDELWCDNTVGAERYNESDPVAQALHGPVDVNNLPNFFTRQRS